MDLTLTVTRGIQYLRGDRLEVAERPHHEHVPCIRVAGDAVQLVHVRAIPDPDGDDVDIVQPRPVRFLRGQHRVGALAVSYHHGNPRHLASGAGILREHLLAHVLERVGGVGAPAHVPQVVYGLEDADAVGVHVEGELLRRVAAELHHAHVHEVPAHGEARHDVFEEVLQVLVIALANTGRRVQQKNDVCFTWTT